MCQARSHARSPASSTSRTSASLFENTPEAISPSALTGAIVSALALSIFFPVGLARRFDPSLGVHTDWHVVLPGAVVVAGFVTVGALLAAVRATSGRIRSAHGRAATFRRRILNTAPLPVALGAGLALDGGRGERALPVRPAITGTIAAIVGIVGALGLVHGIDDALAQPSRSGQIYDAVVTPDSAADFLAFPGKLAKLPQVDEIAHIRHGTADVAGAGLPLWDIEPVRGNLRYSLLSGRPPADGETAIGPSTQHAQRHPRAGGADRGSARPRRRREGGGTG